MDKLRVGPPLPPRENAELVAVGVVGRWRAALPARRAVVKVEEVAAACSDRGRGGVVVEGGDTGRKEPRSVEW